MWLHCLKYFEMSLAVHRGLKKQQLKNHFNLALDLMIYCKVFIYILHSMTGLYKLCLRLTPRILNKNVWNSSVCMRNEYFIHNQFIKIKYKIILKQKQNERNTVQGICMIQIKYQT